MKFDVDHAIAVWFSPGCSVALIGFTMLSFGEDGRGRSGLRASDEDTRTGGRKHVLFSGSTDDCDIILSPCAACSVKNLRLTSEISAIYIKQTHRIP